ncbi:MAG: gliding motility-associated C-terminal domain-containing protein, partial [Owenweeksia sp.]
IPPDSLITAQPQVFAEEPIINQNFWTPVCGVYKAKGGERYITIGNFFTDSETSAVPLLNATNPQKGYVLVDYVEVVENDFPQLPEDSVLCFQGRIDIDITRPDFTYFWEDGSVGGKYTITSPGRYVVRIASPYCAYRDTINVMSVECTDCKVFAPNAFTPNGDGRNDRFDLKANCDLLNYKIQIYDRWGQKVFESTDIDVSWDGLDVNKTATFTYNLQYTFSKFRKTETESRKGYFTLIK